MSAIDSSRGDASKGRGSDLRFAGIVSAAMIATVLTLGALVAPLLTWNGSSGPNARERSQTVRLSKPSPVAPAPATVVAPAGFRADRPAQAGAIALQPAVARPAPGLQIRATVVRRAPGVSPALSRGLAVSESTLQGKGAAPQAAPLATSSDDTDGDGLPDVWEQANGLNPDNASDAGLDSDGDGLDNRTELRLHTAPSLADSDGNGVADGNEDADGDGLRNRIEVEASSDPVKADTNGDGVADAQDDSDGDGVSNLAEQQAGTNPGSGNEVPPVVDGEKDPTPAVTPDDVEVQDDGGAVAPTPPAPDHPDAPGGGAPVPGTPAPAHPHPGNGAPTPGTPPAAAPAPAAAPPAPAVAAPQAAAPSRPAPKAAPAKPAPAKPAAPRAVPPQAAPAKPAAPKPIAPPRPVAPPAPPAPAPAPGGNGHAWGNGNGNAGGTPHGNGHGWGHGDQGGHGHHFDG